MNWQSHHIRNIWKPWCQGRLKGWSQRCWIPGKEYFLSDCEEETLTGVSSGRMEVEFVSYGRWNKLPQIQGVVLLQFWSSEVQRGFQKWRDKNHAVLQEEAVGEKMFSHHFQCLPAACSSLRVPLAILSASVSTFASFPLPLLLPSSIF